MRNRRCARLGIFILSLLCLCFMCPVAAADSGEVLYAARFADYASLRDTGVRLGTSSPASATFALDAGALHIASTGGEKAYLLLPDSGVTADTYTISFTFRFTDVTAGNGYLGVLLSSQGDAPRNRTELLFRADGSIDGYGTSSVLKNAAAARENVTVQIQIRYGFLFGFSLTDGKTTDTFTLSQLNSIPWGGQGFVLRNAEVAISSVMLVNGTDYSTLSGIYATESYVAPDSWELPAPPTDDGISALACIAVGSLCVIVRLRRRA